MIEHGFKKKSVKQKSITRISYILWKDFKVIQSTPKLDGQRCYNMSYHLSIESKANQSLNSWMSHRLSD